MILGERSVSGTHMSHTMVSKKACMASRHEVKLNFQEKIWMVVLYFYDDEYFPPGNLGSSYLAMNTRAFSVKTSYIHTTTFRPHQADMTYSMYCIVLKPTTWQEDTKINDDECTTIFFWSLTATPLLPPPNNEGNYDRTQPNMAEEAKYHPIPLSFIHQRNNFICNDSRTRPTQGTIRNEMKRHVKE